MGLHLKTLAAGGKLNENGFHLIFLRVGYDPVHRTGLPLIHEEILGGEGALFYLVFLEKFRKIAAQRLQNIA